MSVETLPVTPERAPANLDRPRSTRLNPLEGRSLPLTRAVAFTAVGLLMLVSLLLRLRTVHTFYWVDEGLSVGIASHPLRHIPSLLRQDGSPPLYYLLLHFWMAIRGHGEVATHELSMLFGMLTIPTAYWAGTSLFDRRSGLVCALLAAGTPYISVYAEETRMYALLTLLALVVAASFLHAFVFGRRRYLPLFAVSMAASLYTHNWALFLGLMSAAAFVVLVWRTPPPERRALWIDGLLAFGGAALLYLPWLPTLVYQAGHTGAPWDNPPVVWSLSQGTYSIVGGRGAAMVILLAGGSGLLTLRALGGAYRRLQLAVLSLLVLGFGTLLLAWAYSKLTPAWADRYLAVVVAPLLLLAGLGLVRAGRLGLVALALVACFWVLDPIGHSRDVKSNVAAVAGRVRSQLGSNPLVLSTQPEQVPTLAYYLPKVTQFATPLGRTPDPRVFDWRDALARLRRGSVNGTLMPMVRSLTPGQRVLLVIPLNVPKTPLWMKLIVRDSAHWAKALQRDRSLRLIKIFSPAAQLAGVPVRGLLFERRQRAASSPLSFSAITSSSTPSPPAAF